jgi:zinc-ribbon domain
MSQVPGRSCPACGTPVPAGQRFCSNCGTDLTVSGPANKYGVPGGSSPQQVSPYGQQQVPPYAQAPGAFGQQQMPPYQQPQQKSNPIAEALGALGLLFFLRRYRPGYQARRQSSGCCGCLVSLIILLAIFGTPAYFYYRANPNVINQIKNQIQHSSNSINNGNGNGNGSVPTTQPPITTANINQSITYAGVDITIVNVQQSTAFINDNSSATNGMIRVNFKEANNGKNTADFLYGDSAHLILPDNSSVTLANALQSIGPDSGVTRNNWLDFAVPTSDKIDQLRLVLGTAQEAQITIPLTGKADLSAFQARTVNPNKPINYGGLNWTLKSATQALSINGKQATTGMRYVVLTFNVDNPTSGNVNIGFTDEYMRLKAGGVTNPTVATTLPTTINANSSGVNGTVTFLMPENNTAYTLIFLAKIGGIDPQSNTPVNTDFRIQ